MLSYIIAPQLRKNCIPWNCVGDFLGESTSRRLRFSDSAQQFYVRSCRGVKQSAGSNNAIHPRRDGTTVVMSTECSAKQFSSAKADDRLPTWNASNRRSVLGRRKIKTEPETLSVSVRLCRSLSVYVRLRLSQSLSVSAAVSVCCFRAPLCVPSCVS